MKFELETDPAKMAEMSKATAQEDRLMCSSREFPVVFLPATATVGQYLDLLYWCKSSSGPDDCVHHFDETYVPGFLFKTRCKPQYVKHVIAEALKAGGGFVKNAEQLSIDW